MIIGADYISEIVPSEESINNLVLGEDELKTIRGLAKRQNSKHDVWAADFIEGKGAGQIILLHGWVYSSCVRNRELTFIPRPPGVGKTYTVEAIAKSLHRPLLSLTIADIGTVETRVEHELIRWFALAEAWNAILLVDEADIFLERRQNRDLARNGLVSGEEIPCSVFSNHEVLDSNSRSTSLPPTHGIFQWPPIPDNESCGPD